MTPLALQTTLALIGGLCLGSFLNVVVYRLPAGVSLVAPPSACPGCGTPIRPYDNVPVLSWLALRGHCRSCHEPISACYPVTEAVTGALFATVVLATRGTSAVWLDLAFVAALVAIARIDVEHGVIPDRILVPLAVVALATTVIFDPAQIVARVIASACAGGLLLSATLVRPDGMGMGDVKLAAVMGLVLGRAVVPALFVAVLAGALGGVIVMTRVGGQRGRRTRIPFGPFLALGSLVGLFGGQALMTAYVHGVHP